MGRGRARRMLRRHTTAGPHLLLLAYPSLEGLRRMGLGEPQTCTRDRRRELHTPALAVTLVALAGLGTACSAAPIDLGTAGAAAVLFDPDRGLSGVEVTVNGVTFHPLAGAGPLSADGEVDASIPLHIAPSVAGDVLRLHATSPTAGATGIDPGLVDGLGEWRRLDLSRYSGPYGQTWWPKTTYSVEGDFWFTAHWVMEESDGTKWTAPNQANRGTGPFPAALRVEYAPDTHGRYLPIREVLELRFSRHLWDVVPLPRQKPSEYKQFLARAVFLDLWRGTSARDLQHFLEVIEAITRGRHPYYTILQNWSVGGWDAVLPDSMWLPDYPPNIGVGTVEELRALCEFGKTMGRFGFRTNYRILREYSPSHVRGLAHYAVGPDGTPLDYLRPADWPAVAGRADREIKATFGPNACFTDQMTSGAAPWAWHDYAAEGGSRSMRRTLDHQKALARSMKRIFSGPLGSESLADQHLLGEFVDTGDYDIKDGHRRLVSPEYKLRRLHGLSGFHGMGLMYRFYEMPPFDAFHSGTTTFSDDQAQLDDYRATEILFGNGGYVCHGFANLRYTITECLLVGNLQRYYSGQPVRDVRYWHDGSWRSLEELVRSGVVPNIVPWNPQTPEYGRVRVEYGNELWVVVNRLKEDFTVAEAGPEGVTLPPAGWVAWREDSSVLAFSAYWPGTRHRVDYLRNRAADLVYLDPRGQEVDGASAITLREGGRVVLTADPDGNTVTVDGRTLQLEPPGPAPLATIDFTFDSGLEGWRPIRGLLSAEARDGLLRLRVIAPGCYLNAPPLRVDGDRVGVVELRMRVQGRDVQRGGLYFTIEDAPNVHSDKLVNFEVVSDGKFHTYRLDVGAHPEWRGHTITGLRLDPIRGSHDAEVDIDSIRGVER